MVKLRKIKSYNWHVWIAGPDDPYRPVENYVFRKIRNQAFVLYKLREILYDRNTARE